MIANERIRTSQDAVPTWPAELVEASELHDVVSFSTLHYACQNHADIFGAAA